MWRSAALPGRTGGKAADPEEDATWCVFALPILGVLIPLILFGAFLALLAGIS